MAVSSPTWIDGDRIPAEGGCILVLNHISHVDPLVSADFVLAHGRLPRYLAKSGLFTSNRFVAAVLKSASQIPVERLTANAIGAYDAAVAAVLEGECVVVYPEGTLTRDPDLWPMRGKSGAARIALATGAPVIPIGMWGAHHVLPPYSKRPRLFPRTEVTVKVGDQVQYQDLRVLEPTPAVVQEMTDRIMAAIVTIVEDLRGETAPAKRFDPRRAGMKLIGNPNEPEKKRKWGKSR